MLHCCSPNDTIFFKKYIFIVISIFFLPLLAAEKKLIKSYKNFNVIGLPRSNQNHRLKSYLDANTRLKKIFQKGSLKNGLPVGLINTLLSKVAFEKKSSDKILIEYFREAYKTFLKKNNKKFPGICILEKYIRKNILWFYVLLPEKNFFLIETLCRQEQYYIPMYKIVRKIKQIKIKDGQSFVHKDDLLSSHHIAYFWQSANSYKDYVKKNAIQGNQAALNLLQTAVYKSNYWVHALCPCLKGQEQLPKNELPLISFLKENKTDLRRGIPRLLIQHFDPKNFNIPTLISLLASILTSCHQEWNEIQYVDYEKIHDSLIGLVIEKIKKYNQENNTYYSKNSVLITFLYSFIKDLDENVLNALYWWSIRELYGKNFFKNFTVKQALNTRHYINKMLSLQPFFDNTDEPKITNKMIEVIWKKRKSFKEKGVETYLAALDK